MKDYWLVIDEESKSIEICFPEDNMNLINALMATMNSDQLIELKNKLDKTTTNTEPFVINYEYGSLKVDPYNIDVQFTMFDDETSCFLYTRVFREALNEYLQELNKLFDESKGMSK